MIVSKNYFNKSFVILGLGRSGTALAEALIQSGAKVLVWDDNPDALLAACKRGFEAFNRSKKGRWEGIDILLVSPGVPFLHPKPHDIILEALNAQVPIDNDIGLFFSILETTKKTFKVPPKVIAVTGSNGKSTTSSLIHHILGEAGIITQFGGNIGLGVFDLKPVQNDEVIVLELSSYQLEVAQLLSPDIAIFTNFSPDHLDRHGGVQGYFLAKKRLFDSGHSNVSIINVDSKEGLMLLNKDHSSNGDFRSIKVTSKFLTNTKDWMVGCSVGRLVEMKGGKEIFTMSLKLLKNLPGEHNQENICLAYAACKALGVESNVIKAAVKNYIGLKHRIQLVGIKHGVKYINDSKATNSDSTSVALKTFKNIHWICGGAKKEGKLTSLTLNTKSIKKAYVIGKNPIEFATQLGFEPYELCGSMEDAVKSASELAIPGDTVLLSPAAASFDQYQNFEKRGEHFIDLVKKIL
jgi:UDP-N-acetylmuramoylalanine--D-glutamate ligase